MNKKILLPTFLLSATLLTACGENDNSTASAGGEGETQELKVAGIMPADHPDTVALEKMADTVAEQTDGRITMEIFPSNQLGDYTLVYEELGRGTIDMGLISAPSILDSRMEIGSLPYLFQNYEEVKANYTMDSFVGQTFQEIHNEQNVQLLGFHAQGFGGVGSVNEISEPLDFSSDKNVLLRVPEMDVFIKNAQDLGFDTVSLPYADLYTALQAGTVEGWVGGHPQINYMQFRDVIDYYYQYNNFFESTHLLIGQDVWNSFSEEDQQIIQAASDELTKTSFENAEQLEEEYRQTLQEEGIEVFEFTEEELAQFAERSYEESWPTARDAIGEDLMDQILESIR